MSTNGARKTPAASGTKKNNNNNTGIVDEAMFKNTFTEKDKKSVKIRVRKPTSVQSNAGNWRENEITKVAPQNHPATPESPLVNQLDDDIVGAFVTGRPLEEKPDFVQCKHCKRPVTRPMSAAHIKECLTKKAEKLKKKKEAKEAKDAASRKEKGEKDGDDESVKGARKTALKGADGEGAKKGKKRKADDDSKQSNKKKLKKDEPKAKAAKPKGPVDVERQCGVQLPNGGQCARSLTCKSHSMGLKRAVPGRSQMYDILLAQYQRKNQAKQQRAAIEANAAPVEDDTTQGPIDSDEEKEAIMAAIARSRPQPMVIRPLISTRAKYQHVRMKEMLRTALGPSTRNANGILNHTAFNPPLSANIPTPIDTNIAAHHRGSLLGSAALTSAGFGDGTFGFGSPAGSTFGDAQEARRQNSIAAQGGGGGTARQILPGQLPGPGSRKPSIAAN